MRGSAANPRYFYQFLGAHSLLIGLLPFFLPVYLWTSGLGLTGLCLLIGVSGISFALSLKLWQLLAMHWPLRRLIGITFICEIALVFVAGLLTEVPGLGLYGFSENTMGKPEVSVLLSATLLGIFNGAYNAFFWTTQRTLFLKQLGKNDTGKQYGNFQIFVTLFLKAGILLGGLLLENDNFVWLLALSAGVGAVSHGMLANSSQGDAPLLAKTSYVGLRQSLFYKDNQGSRVTFALDGLFLYLESHLWTLSLFLVVKQDFSTLGLAVVLLAAGFALMFFLIKNRIDTLPIDRVYTAAVWLYSLAWLLRSTLSDTTEGASLLTTLLLITFFSSFFRLAFNKRFFDVARRENTVQYLLVKSYSSQWILGIFFIVFSGLLWIFEPDAQLVLQISYAVGAGLALVYLVYRDSSYRNSVITETSP